MNELMRSEILDQPGALEESLASLRGQLDAAGLAQRWSAVVFTGSGDSYCAPLALQYAARLLVRAPVSVLPALEAARYFPFSPGMLVVTISVSGEAKQTVESARTARDAGASVLSITGNAESTLAGLATRRLLLEFRSRSRRTPHTTDFLTTLLAVAAIVEALGGERVAILDELPAAVGELVAAHEQPCLELGRELAARDRFVFLGAGPSFAVAQYGAEKFWEAGGLEAHAFELDEFAHGAHFLLEPGDPVFVLAPAGRSSARVEEICEGLYGLGARVVALADSALPEEWSPFATAVPVQWLCWAIATAKGYDVERKDGRHADPGPYELAHERWVKG